MTLPKQKQHEILFLLLYASLIAPQENDDAHKLIMEQLKVTKSSLRDAQFEVGQILDKIVEIDDMIKEIAKSYDFERIQSTEKTALRLGAYELFFNKKMAPKAAIAESLRLAKKFGTPTSISFVNALLDTLYKKSLGENVTEDVST